MTTPAHADRSQYLEAVRHFADQVLEHGRDRYGDTHTPLFVDGIQVDTHEPATWRYRGQTWVLSNFANQQNLLRTLVGLSNLTGDERYREAAVAATRHMFEHQRHACGLLYWGGHQIVDLLTNENRGLDADCHEFKNTFPFYPFLWEVEPAGTRAFINAFWNAHVMDWCTLDFNRHGAYGKPLGPMWDREPCRDVDPFFESEGLTFINAGTDLIYAAATLQQLDGDAQALAWSKRLARRYVNARHPDTGLGVYQYSKPRRRETPPAEGPLTGELTLSRYGDRAENQFGEQYGPVAREGWALFGQRATWLYVANGLVQMYVAERLGDEGADLLQWTVDGLKAYHRYAYDAAGNCFRPMWADGTDLTGHTIQRTGYLGPAGTSFQANPADGAFLLVYARAYRLSRDAQLWEAVRSIGAGLGLGELGSQPGQAVHLNMNTAVADDRVIFALLELARATPSGDLCLALAERVADNLLAAHLHKGFFVPSPQHLYAQFDTSQSLALLALEATRRGRPDLVPTYIGSRGYTHGLHDGYDRRINDTHIIWAQTRNESE